MLQRRASLVSAATDTVQRRKEMQVRCEGIEAERAAALHITHRHDPLGNAIETIALNDGNDQRQGNGGTI